MSKIIDKAKEEESKDNFEVALTYYEMGLSDPSCPFDIRCDMGVVYNKIRNFKEGLSCFDTVLNMDENHVDSLFGKGISYLGLNRWDDALDLFKKIKEIDSGNANVYYYISIILQCKNDDGAYEYYSKFMELDNEEFGKIRSYYKFGLKFLNAELELSNTDDKKINLKEFEDILKSFNLDDDEIDTYLKILPYEELISKINELNDIFHADNEKRIIRKAFKDMGLDDEDIDDYFDIYTIDKLKKDIISRTKENPFPVKTEIDIPLYGGYTFKELVIEDDLSGTESKTSGLENLFQRHYSLIREEISNNNIKEAKWFCDFIDGSKISDKSFRANFIYMDGLLSSYLNLDLNKVLEDFKKLEKDFPEITDDKNYIHNKDYINYNLEKHNQEMV